MTLSNNESVIFCIEKRRRLLYEVSPDFGSFFSNTLGAHEGNLNEK